MLTYATYDDFLRARKVDATKVGFYDERVIRDYLRRATSMIDEITRRRFVPYYETRSFAVPLIFADLRNRALTYQDLTLDNDLLEPAFVQTGPATVIAVGETLAAPVTASATTFTAGTASLYTVGDILQMDNERLRVLEINSVTVTVERGVLGTIAGAHAAGITVYKMNLEALVQGIDYHLLDFNTTPRTQIRLVYPNAWGSQFGVGLSREQQEPQIFITGWWGFHSDYANAWVDTLETIPGAGLTASATTLTATDADDLDAGGEQRFEAGNVIRVESELMVVSEISGNVLTLLRGQLGTRAVAHDAGATIQRYRVQEWVREVCVSIAATLRDRAASVGGRQGVSDMSQGVPVTISETDNRLLRDHRRPFIV